MRYCFCAKAQCLRQFVARDGGAREMSSVFLPLDHDRAGLNQSGPIMVQIFDGEYDSRLAPFQRKAIVL
jgi:hypothetical protein